jgi:hypothetical protein
MPTPFRDDFLGTGWGFPPEFVEITGAARMASGVQDIRESLHILLSTRPGERVMLPEYGCDLARFVFRTATPALFEEVRDVVGAAIARWEPRIVVTRCDAAVDAEDPARLMISVAFSIRRSAVTANFIFPMLLSDGRKLIGS